MWALAVAAASLGCSSELAGTVNVTLAVQGVDRDFRVVMPPGPGKHPAAFFFHGQQGDIEEISKEHASFTRLAAQKGFITVFPAASKDVKGKVSAWNVGAKGDTATCDTEMVKEWSYPVCYDSCDACGECDWASCVDDVAFVQAMVAHLVDKACADSSRLHAYGESNGAMLVYHLVQALPGVFSSVVPAQGLPLRGYLPGSSPDAAEKHLQQEDPDDVAMPAILTWFGDKDKTMPVDGTTSVEGFKYETLAMTLQSFAAIAECEIFDRPEEVSCPFMTGDKGPFTACRKYAACGEATMTACTFRGGHEDIPKGSDSVVMEFFTRHHRPSLVQLQQRVAVDASGGLAQVDRRAAGPHGPAPHARPRASPRRDPFDW